MVTLSERQTAPDVMLRAIWQSVSSLKSRFNLSEAELLAVLGDMPRSTMHRGIQQQNVKVSRDVRDRVSLLLGIYKGLRVLFEDSEQALTWIDRENTLPPFNGRKPRGLMVNGDFMALASVRQFVDYWRG